MNNESNNIREAVGVFDNDDTLQAAIDDLQSQGFARRELSVLASESAVEEKLGHRWRRVEEIEDDPKVPRTIFVPIETIGEAKGALIGYPLYIAATAAAGMVVASGGTLLATIIAALSAGSGAGLIGYLLATLVGQHHADYLQHQIERGGLLLWVHTKNPDYEKKAMDILRKHSAHDVHVHDIAVDGDASVVDACRAYLKERKAV